MAGDKEALDLKKRKQPQIKIRGHKCLTPRGRELRLCVVKGCWEFPGTVRLYADGGEG